MKIIDAQVHIWSQTVIPPGGGHRQVSAYTAEELLAEIRLALMRYENLVRELRAESFGSLREVGRRRLPVTAVSLAIHIAEHGQRHTGQLVSAARLARATTL